MHQTAAQNITAEDFLKLVRRGAEITDIHLSGEKLNGIDLSYVTFVNCSFTLVSMQDAKLERAVFRNCTFLNVFFQRSVGEEMCMHQCDAVLVNFDGASLTKMHVALSTWRGVLVAGADLTGLLLAQDVRFVCVNLFEAQSTRGLIIGTGIELQASFLQREVRV
jgi:uncharacterized protein YjbI with pentapeptide repeats